MWSKRKVKSKFVKEILETLSYICIIFQFSLSVEAAGLEINEVTAITNALLSGDHI